MKSKKPGDVFEIPLANGDKGYGLKLKDGPVAIYAHVGANQPPEGFNIFLGVVAVDKSSLNLPALQVVRTDALGKRSNIPLPPWYLQDLSDETAFQRYDIASGNLSKATREDCKGLEQFASWSLENLQERIGAFAAGTPNAWASHLPWPPQMLTLSIEGYEWLSFGNGEHA